PRCPTPPAGVRPRRGRAPTVREVVTAGEHPAPPDSGRAPIPGGSPYTLRTVLRERVHREPDRGPGARRPDPRSGAHGGRGSGGRARAGADRAGLGRPHPA